MNKRTSKLLLVFSIIIAGLIGLIALCKNIKVDEFHPASTIFVVDASASNQNNLEEQKRFVKNLCSRLDPEDQVKIIRVSEDAYLIYEGSALNTKGITKSLNSFTQYDAKDWGTAYGEGLKKAFTYATVMKKEGYKPAIVVIGDLENEGNIEKQINWKELPKQTKEVQTQAPDLVMMFVYAHPQKLDVVKETLAPVLGEQKLIISTEENIDKTVSKFINAIGR